VIKLKTRRAQRQKGSSFEYSVNDSLNQILDHKFILTKQLGFVRQFDIEEPIKKIAIECKFLKSITWNQCVKYHNKLRYRTPEYFEHYLIFKTNQQPVLVMYVDDSDKLWVSEFETVFGVDFIEHNKSKTKLCRTDNDEVYVL